MHPFFGSKPPNIRKLDMLGKMSALSFKIPKVGVSNYRQKYEKFIKELNQKIRNQVVKQIVDSMLGVGWVDKQQRNQKTQTVKQGQLDSHTITICPGWHSEFFSQLGIEGPYFPQIPVTRTIRQLKHLLFNEHVEKYKRCTPEIDLTRQALKNVQQQGIIFIDQIDKLATPEGVHFTGKGVSTDGVQRDLLPIIEGTSISTKFGQVKTDHILFIGSGSFSMTKVEDLIPELLGRLPVRVTVHPITLEQLVRILIEPEFNLIMQQTNLFKAENVDLKFTKQAIEEMAEISFNLNQNTQNIGARRLHSIVEKVVQDESFQASEKKGEQITITKQYVANKLAHTTKTINLQKFLL